uniref:Uncharacterized protein n=1 Tax=Anguilla anguilla TaxID=7936 RepID=A0A0E9PBQ5_ANGAN
MRPNRSRNNLHQPAVHFFAFIATITLTRKAKICFLTISLFFHDMTAFLN